jgi:hypothetical protein
MLTSARRQVFATLAETLIPAGDTMPSATTADVSGALLDQVLGYRPDLVDALTAALDSSVGKDPEAALDNHRPCRGRLLPQPRGEGRDALRRGTAPGPRRHG